MLSLEKQDSTIITSTHTYESTVLPSPITKIWGLVRDLSLNYLAPNKIVSSEYVEGCSGKVGSTIRITFTDKSVWLVKTLEISDIHHFITYEVIDTQPAIKVSSVTSTIKLSRVSDVNHTFFSWDHDFSNDADAQVIQDNKFKKLEFYADMKLALTKK